jgi:YaaC-like protein
MANIPDARTYTGSTRVDWVEPVKRAYSTLPDITEELFTMLRYVSEVEEQTLRCIKQFHPAASDEELQKHRRKTQSFLKQAEGYFRVAQKLPYRSSALLFYYSFMNLAKALLEIRNVPYNSHHGLTPHIDDSAADMQRQSVRRKRDGIFSALYRLEFGEELPGQSISLKELLARVSEITFQFESAILYARQAFVQCKARILVDGPAKESWALLALPGNIVATLPSGMKPSFEQTYEQVNLDKNNARLLLDFFADRHQGYWYFQSRVTVPLTPEGAVPMKPHFDALHASLGKCLDPRYIDDEWDFTVVMPVSTQGATTIYFREYMAVYLTMFYLGSLVRYRPDYLESLLGSTAAWILESFVNSAPLHALRVFASKISGYVYALNK